MHWLKRKKLLLILLLLQHEVKPKKLLRTTKNLHEYNSQNSYSVIEKSSLRNVSFVTNQVCHVLGTLFTFKNYFTFYFSNKISQYASDFLTIRTLHGCILVNLQAPIYRLWLWRKIGNPLTGKPA